MRTHIILLVVCLFSQTLALFGQGARGTITGTVLDPAGAVVPNALIEAKNVATGSPFSTTSTNTGNYTLSELPLGQYELTVTAPGFKEFVRQNLTVQAAQTQRVDATLEVGAATESITVSDQSSMLKSDTADVSHNVTVQSLNELPILGIGASASGSAGIRNPNNVVELVPGTYYQPNAQVKINGAPSNTQAFHVEGQDATNQGFPYAAAQTQPSVDAIQEVAVQTSSFAPEFGAAAGGFFNVTMKSGTNAFHGSAYDYFVNEVLNAGSPFTNNGSGDHIRPSARRNDYGGTVGGPVIIPKLYNGRDRSFFFFNFEQFRETQNINNIPITVPSVDYRNGNFGPAIAALGNRQLGTDVLGRTLVANTIYDPTTTRLVNGVAVADPFPNNTIPIGKMDPVALKIQSAIPLPNQPGLINNYLPTYPSVRHTTIPSVKIDQNIGSKGKLAFYWSTTQTNSQFSPFYGGADGLPDVITAARGSFIHSHVERLNYDHTLSPTMLLHIGAGYQQNNFFDDAPILDFNAQTTWGLQGATLNRNVPVFTGICPGTPPAAPICTAAGGIGYMGPAAGQSHNYWQKPSANLSLTWVKQNHTFKFGSEGYVQGTPAFPYTNTSGTYAFSNNQTSLPYTVGTTFTGGSLGFPYASFLLGAVDQYSVAAPAEFRFGKKQIAVFAQDSWKMTRKLTLTYGVRWDYGTYYTEQYGRAMSLSPSLPNPSAGGQPGAWIFEGSRPGDCNCQFADNYPFAIGPRVGVAYQIGPKTVIRGGWGLVYNQTSTNQGGVNTPGIATSNTVGSPGQGIPATTLAMGIPQSSIPVWPNFSPGVSPISPIGNQPTPVLGVGGFSNAGFVDPQMGRPARQNQWNIGIQHEILSDLVVDVAYVANRGVWWNAPGLVNMNALTPDRLASFGLDITNPADQALLLSTLGSATAAQRGFNKPPYTGFGLNNTVAQSLRPFPQFGTINAVGPPLGKTWYDGLQAKVTKRLSHGLNLNAAFAWQKSLQQGVDTNTVLNNVLANPANAKSYSSFDQPFTFVLAASYALPRWNTNKYASYALRDWQVGAVLQYASGLPIPAPAATTSLYGQLFQGTAPNSGTLANRVPGQSLYSTNWVDRDGVTHTEPLDINCHCFDPTKTLVYNPAAWVNPPAGQFGNSAEFYGDFRYQRRPTENMNLARNFRITERVGLHLRVEFNNIFNRMVLNNPTGAALSPFTPASRDSSGSTVGGYGFINRAISATQVFQPRNGVIVARLTF